MFHCSLLRAKITMHSTIILHVFRVEVTCDKIVGQHKKIY